MSQHSMLCAPSFQQLSMASRALNGDAGVTACIEPSNGNKKKKKKALMGLSVFCTVWGTSVLLTACVSHLSVSGKKKLLEVIDCCALQKNS